MDQQLKQRLVGAAVLALAAVIVLPLMLDEAPERPSGIDESLIPPEPDSGFQSRIVPLEAAPAEPATAPETPAAAVPTTAAAATPVEPAAAQPAPAEARPAERIPASPQVRVGLAAWAVQLGSFANPENAIKLRDRLKKLGYTAFVETVYLEEGKKTRVYVGPELERAISEQALKKLIKDVDMHGIVVKYPAG
jgi:DedD protein